MAHVHGVGSRRENREGGSEPVSRETSTSTNSSLSSSAGGVQPPSDDALRDNRRALGFVLRNLATTGMAAADACVQLGSGEDVEIYNDVKPAIDFLFRVAGKFING